MIYFRNLGMKQKYVSDPFVRISLCPKQAGPNYHMRRKSDDSCSKEQKRTSVRNIVINYHGILAMTIRIVAFK